MADDVIASLRAVIGADTSGFEKGVKGVRGALSGLGGLIGSLGLVGLFTTAIQKASDAQTSIAQLNAVLASTKGIAGLAAQELEGMAGSLSKVTRYSKGEIRDAESLLLTFTKIGKKVFPDATEAILDMSTAMKQDLRSSVIQIGKALNDPIQGVTALRRVGVQLTDAQEAQIKGFMRTNQLAKAQAVILQELQTEFGGSARAAGKTFAGQMDILNHSISSLLTQVGMALLPVLSKFIDFASNIVGKLQEVDPGLVQLAAAVGLVVVAAGPLGAILGTILGPIGLIVGAVIAVKKAFDDNFLGIRDTIENTWSMIQPTVEKIVGAIKGFFEILSGGGAAQVEGPNKMWEKMNPDKMVLGFGDRLKKALETAGPTLLEGFGTLFTKVGNWLRNTAIPDIVNAIKDFAPKAVDWLLNTGIPQLAATFGNLAGEIAKFLIANVPTFIQNVADFIGTAVTFLMTTGIPTLANALVTGIQTALRAFLSALGVDWETTFGPESNLAKTFNAFFGSGGIMEKVVGFATGILQGISNFISGIIDGINQAIQGFNDLLGRSRGDVTIPGTGGKVVVSGNKTGINLSGTNTVRDFNKAMSDMRVPGRDIGGPVTAGQSYRIGTPEIFTPASSGKIIPLGGATVGGGVSIGALTLNGVNDPRAMFDAIMAEARRRNERGW